MDNYTADRLEAFDTLNKILEKTGGSKVQIDEIGRSLKSNFENRSDFFREQCTHSQNEVCRDCENVFSCFATIKELIANPTLSSEIKDKLMSAFSTASAYILEWMNHILRGTHTQSTKESIFEKLSESRAMVLEDWIMKIIPQKYREKIEEWFGKKVFLVM